MGSSAPAAPTPPDPVATASAQAQANAGTATAQTALNNTNQITPYGSLTYNVTGSQSYTNPDGSTSTVPTYTSTQTLSPAEQALFDQQNALGQQSNAAASTALSTLQGSLNNPVTASRLPALHQSVGTGPTLLGGYDTGGAIQSSYDPGGSLQSGYASGGTIQNGYASGGAIQSSVPWSAEGTSAPSTFGQTATSIQGDVNLNNNTPTTFGQTANGVQYFNGGDFSAERDAATNAALARLAPSMATQQETLNASLANQGLAQGSAAWNAAQLSQAQANNDLRLGAVATGDAEQQALFGEQATGNQLFNAAQQQDYSQQQGRGLFGMQATAQNNAATLDMANFHNSAQAQDFGQQQARGEYAQNAYAMDNAAIGANNTAALNAGNFANAAQLQQNTENANAAAFSNSAQAQAEQENAARAAFSNATQATQNQENAAAAAFSNQAQAQGNSQNQQQASFYNNANNQQYQNWIQGSTFANQAREQSLTDQETINNNSVNQISALLHGGQATTGQYQGYTPGQIGQTPISQDTYASANLAEQNYQTESQAAAQNNAAMFSALGGLFGMGGKMFGMSDRRLKRDVIAFGPITGGLPVYAFRYAWDADDGPFTLGHMADEVAAVRPDAVHRHPSGFDMVDYGAL